MTGLSLTRACARGMIDQAFNDACAPDSEGIAPRGSGVRDEARNWLTSQNPSLAAICWHAETPVHQVVDRATRLREQGWPAPATVEGREVWSN